MPRIYLDYAASTPVDSRVLRAMTPYFSKKFGNPGSLHSFGQEAIAAVDSSREVIAKAIGASFREIIFTGSATEANNIALRGAVAAFRNATGETKPRIIISAIEHESILETARALARDGVEIIYIPVDEQGVVNMDAIKRYLNERTAIVSIMYANNEMGAIQPIAEIGAMIAAFRHGIPGSFPLFHSDAAQAFQFLDCRVEPLGLDLMTLSAHKIYGPKGVGILYIEEERLKELASSPVITGGGQEFGIRSGTENVPTIVGFSRAAELAVLLRDKEGRRVRVLRNDLWTKIKNIIPDAALNGSLEGSLPNILNIYLPGRTAEQVLTKLDLHGIAAASGSACRSRALEASYVIEALGYSAERARASIRFSLGRGTTKREIAAVVKVLSGETF